MNTIGNSLAFGILILISIVFFRTKHYLTKASEYYRICLILSFITSAFNTTQIAVASAAKYPSWIVIGITTTELLLVFILTSVMALYLTAKITEHIIGDHTLRFAKVILSINASLFSIILICNLFGKFIFYVADDGSFVNTPLEFLPYLVLIPQLAVVGFYCVKYKKRLNKKVLFALTESFLAVLFSFGLKCVYDIKMIALALSLVQLIFFLDFQRQKMGTNSVTKLNDGSVFFSEIGKLKSKKINFKVYLIMVENIGTVKINHGQQIGDEALYRFATALDHLFIGGTAYNMYGSCFTLIIHDETTDTNHNKKLLEFLNEEIIVNGAAIKFQCIVSEHTWTKEESSIDAFYEKLEYAVNSARENKLQFITYTLETELTRLREKYLVNRMQTVAQSTGFELWFQPIFNNEKNRFSSVEVLLRLKEKNGSYISPAEFIPIAEKTGQITHITWFVIDQTCHVLSETPELENIRASINLPMLHIVDPSFEYKLNAIVDKYNIPHERISFEFTERVILDDLSIAEKNMRRLVKSGYSFYLDDFGVGYSNFNCVLRLPLKTVKLDMSLTATAENQNIVCSLTDLFHDMGLKVVAEGAETADQVDILRAFGVDSIQGYYFAKPMPLKSLCVFLKKNEK